LGCDVDKVHAAAATAAPGRAATAVATAAPAISITFHDVI
jgi:hypothetical protein